MKKPIVMAFAALCALPAALASQPAAPPNPTTWTLAGPTRTDWRGSEVFSETSGRVLSVAVDTAGTIYVGTTGGVWKRVGASWRPLTDFAPSLVARSIAIDPSNAATIYVGTGAMSKTASYYGAGILKSTDAGATWTHIAGPFIPPARDVPSDYLGASDGGARILALAVSPNDPRVLLAAVEMHRGDASASGVYRSADGGLTWAPVIVGEIGTAVLFHPTEGNVAYAALSSLDARAARGIYKSTNAGRSWTRLNDVPGSGLPTTNTALTQLAISRSDPLTLYAGIGDGSVFANLLGLYRTTNGGTAWTRVAGAPNYCAPYCSDWNQIAIHPRNPNVVLLGGSQSPVIRTIDGFATWQPIRGTAPTALHHDTWSFAFSPTADTVYVGHDGGISWSDTYRSTTPGWNFLNDNLAITQFFPGIDLDPADGNHAFAGTQDNGVQYFTGSLLWRIVTTAEGGYVRWDPATNTVYQAGSTLPYESVSGNYGYTPSASGISLTEPSRLPLTPGMPLAFLNANPAVQYTGTSRVYRTADRQRSWRAISDSLTVAPEFISAVAVAAHDPDVVCVGSSRGRAWCTRNASAATPIWSDRSAGLPRRYLTQLTINEFKEYEVCAVFSGFSGAVGAAMDTIGHVFYSNEFGANWRDMTRNLPNAPVNDCLIDARETPQRIYVATDVGVYRTYYRTIDDMHPWAPVATGLPRAPVTGVRLHEETRTLFASTLGRSMWRLAVPLRGEAPEAGPAIALRPWRMRFRATAGGPNPPSQPLQVINAANPRTAATTLDWTATSSTSFGGAWLSAAPVAGVDDGTVSVAVNVAGLAAGHYNGVVRVAAAGSTNGAQELQVLLEVTASTAMMSPMEMLKRLSDLSKISFAPGVEPVERAAERLAAGYTAAACGSLRSYENRVKAGAGKEVAEATAKELLDAAAEVARAIKCRPGP